MIPVSRIVLVLIKAMIEILLMSMKAMEQSGSVDADGIPLDDDYQKQGFFLAGLRDLQKVYEENETE